MAREPLVERMAAAGPPGRPAIIGAHGTLTRGELFTRARRLAACLGPSETPVVVHGRKQPAVLAAFLAASWRGRAYVPIDPALPPARIGRMLAAVAPADAVLVDEPTPEVAREIAACGIAPVHVDALAADVPHAARADVEPVAAPPHAIAYVVFTSGTTGDPKGVAIPVGALEHFVDWLLATHAFAGGAETFLNQAPFGFDLSVMDVYGALLTGGTLVTLDRDEAGDPRRLFARLDGAPLTTWVSTPSFARLCVAERRFAGPMLPALRRFLFCGETLPPELARELLQRFPQACVWNMYGPTETTVAVTTIEITPALAASDRPLPVGRAAPGMDVWIADPDDPRRRLPAGTRGEIVIAGAQVAAGYLTAPASTQGARDPFVTLDDGRRAYRTGDLGVVDAAGVVFCAGRLDRQVKLRGYRLELEEIEAHLRAIAGVDDAAVLAVDRDGRPDHLVAFVVGLPARGRALTMQVREALAASLPEHALPRLVHGLDALPLTAQGKVDQRRLREFAT